MHENEDVVHGPAKLKVVGIGGGGATPSTG